SRLAYDASAPRSPPPFPPRRSSDLNSSATFPAATDGASAWAMTFSLPQRGTVPYRAKQIASMTVLLPAPVGPEHGHRRDLLRPRSEEHTSELQSREKLVCRRLLEKK